MGADVIGNLVLVEALGLLDSLPQYLQIGIGPRREIITERIDTLACRLWPSRQKGFPVKPTRTRAGAITAACIG